MRVKSLEGKKVIVTGGLGFIGQNLVRELVTAGARVIAVDDCSNSSTKVLDDIRDLVEIYTISVLDASFLELITDDVHYIFHLACRSIITCSDDPLSDLRVNAESTLKILEYLRYNMPSSFDRFIYTSSCSVYGSPRTLPVSEDGHVAPLSQYAATKMLGERYTLMYSKMYSIPAACTRFSNVYGYGQTPDNPYCGVIGLFIDQASKGEEVVIYGDGEQTRDYTFIQDAVRAAIVVGLHPKAYGEVYNVATNREVSINHMAQHLKTYHFPQLKIRHAKERYIDNIRRRVIDISKINQDLSWYPEITLEEGLNRTIDWYRSQAALQHVFNQDAAVSYNR